MRDVNEMLFPNETIKYQYAYPLWMKILGAAGLVWVIYTLYVDFIAGRTIWVVVEIVMLLYLGYWLWMMQRDSGQYVVTNMRVMNLGKTPADDELIEYPQVSEVRVLKDSVSGSRQVQVKALDARVIRVPIPGMGQAKSFEMVQMINQYRGIDPDAPGEPAAGLPAAGLPDADTPAEPEADSPEKN